MPRAKDVVMNKHDPAQLRSHAHRRAVELAEPYRVYSAKKRGVSKEKGWAIVHVPTAGDRAMVMENLDKEGAQLMKAMLEAAWVAGRISAMLD